MSAPTDTLALCHTVARRLWARFGVRFRYVKSNAGYLTHLERAPFSDSVGIDGAVVLYSAKAQAGNLIHEAGHILFGFDRSECEFFAWEWHVAQWLDIEPEWRECNEDYGLPDQTGSFGDLWPDDQDALLRKLDAAMKPYVRRQLPRSDTLAVCHIVARRLWARFGVRFLHVPDTCEGYLAPEVQSPFDGSVGIEGSTVLYSDRAPPGHLIHEAGHVLFGFEREEYEFFVWEWHVAQWLGIEAEWREINRYYGVSAAGKEFGHLSREEQDTLLRKLDVEMLFDVRRMLPRKPRDQR